MVAQRLSSALRTSLPGGMLERSNLAKDRLFFEVQAVTFIVAWVPKLLVGCCSLTSESATAVNVSQ